MVVSRGHAAGFRPPPLVYPPDTILSMPTTPATARPGYLTPIIDPVFGGKITRITNTSGQRSGYSRRQQWNADGTVLGMLYVSNPTPFLDGNTYAFLKTMQRGSEFVWSNTDPDIGYTTNDVNKLQRVRYSTGAITDVHDFGSTKIYIGEAEGSLSNNDRYVGLHILVGAQWKVVTFDIVGDTIISTQNTTAQVNNECISQDGNWMEIQYATTGSGSQKGTWIYPASDLNTGNQILTNTSHCDWGVDTNGDQVLVIVADSTDGNGVAMFRASDLRRTKLFPYTSGANRWGPYNALTNGHVSCRNILKPGWAVFSAYRQAEPFNDPSPWIYFGDDQIVAVKLDPAPPSTAGGNTVKPYCQTYQSLPLDPTYGYGPMASPSPDMQQVTYGTDWDAVGADGTTPLYGYVVEYPG